ncbi:hypothetical protein BC628DRAFT_1409732 [Trametes gibbosa]|nr:hypothetical protein BC628DRAFT_1409732 [Trametes gibbosa]
MSGFDDLCACFAVLCSCCCVSCNEASGLFCFYKSCNCCSRRSMDDNDFERTVEELYAPDKDGTRSANAAAIQRAHILELEPRSGGTGTGTGTGTSRDATVCAQPGARPSMEAPGGRRSADEHVDGGAAAVARDEGGAGEPRGARRERTREWVNAHAHSKSEPGGDAPPGSASRPRSRSHVDGAAREEGRGAKAGGGSVRGLPRPLGQGQGKGGASDAQAYVDAVERAWKKSGDEGPRDAALPGEKGEVRPSPEPASSVERKASAPRLDIPASLRPGRPSSWQLSFQPQAASEHSAGGGGAS